MSRRLARDLTREWAVALLALGLGSLTLLLAALGLYAVLSYGVARRTQEIGVRMALGARRAEVLRLVGGQGARLTFAGLATGLLATAAESRHLSRYLSGLLFGVTPLDPAAPIQREDRTGLIGWLGREICRFSLSLHRADSALT